MPAGNAKVAISESGEWPRRFRSHSLVRSPEFPFALGMFFFPRPRHSKWPWRFSPVAASMEDIAASTEDMQQNL
jgi:hypothetical protein